MPMKNDGGRIAISTAGHSSIVFQPCFTVHSRNDMLATAAMPVIAWAMPSSADRSRRERRITAATSPPSAMPPSTVVNIAVKASVVAMTNCSINRNHTISRPREAKPETRRRSQTGSG